MCTANLCRRCFCFMFSLGLSALSLWLVFNTSTPTCIIQEFDVYALSEDTSDSSSTTTGRNNTIHYDLTLKNRNFNKGVYYDALNLTFYYKPNLVNDGVTPIGNATFPPFYQGLGKGTHRIGDFEAIGVNWENNTTLIVLRVELATSIRYKYGVIKTKRHGLVLGADLKVNDEGSLVKVDDNKGIKLSSNAKRSSMGHFEVLSMLCVLLVIHIL